MTAAPSSCGRCVETCVFLRNIHCIHPIYQFHNAPLIFSVQEGRVAAEVFRSPKHLQGSLSKSTVVTGVQQTTSASANASASSRRTGARSSLRGTRRKSSTTEPTANAATTETESSQPQTVGGAGGVAEDLRGCHKAAVSALLRDTRNKQEIVSAGFDGKLRWCVACSHSPQSR